MKPIALDHYWSQTSESLLAALASSPEGLITSESVARLQQFGHNLLEAREKATPFKLFLNQFKSPLLSDDQET